MMDMILHKTPAKELVVKFYYKLPNNGTKDWGLNSCDRRWNEAVDCALLCIEQLEQYSQAVEPVEAGYWENMKQEVQNLKK